MSRLRTETGELEDEYAACPADARWSQCRCLARVLPPCGDERLRDRVDLLPGPDQEISGPTNPYAQNTTAMSEGRELFVRMNCSGCHGGRAGGGMGPSLRDEDWLYGNTDQQIFSTILEGRAHGMPSWGKKLTNDEAWKLVAYVKSLRTPNEPHPPS